MTIWQASDGALENLQGLLIISDHTWLSTVSSQSPVAFTGSDSRGYVSERAGAAMR